MLPSIPSVSMSNQEQQSSSATSRQDIEAAVNSRLEFATGSGSRGFVNNVNMQGRQVNDMPATTSSGGGLTPWLIGGAIGLALLAGLYLWRKT